MTLCDQRQAWARQAQVDAERGVIECRMCSRRSGLDETTTLWRNGVLVFAICDRCATTHEVLMKPTDKGVEVRGRRVSPLIAGAPI
jgi:hypothetical protein